MNRRLYAQLLIFITLFDLVTFSCDYLISNKSITQGIYFYPKGLNPARNYDFYEFQIYSQIYETLLTIGDDYISLEPRLAQSWSASNDMKTYLFLLKSGIEFHDGSSLNANTVVYSFNYQLRNRPRHSFFKMIKNIWAIDSLTIQIELKYPFAPFLYTLTSPHGLHAISQKALKKYGDNIDKHPCGTGPFYLYEWIEDKYITLKSFSKYREKNTIDQVKFVLPSNTSEAEIQFKNGQLDILYMVAGYWLDRLKWLGRVEYYVQKPLSTLFIGFNLRNKPVDQLKVRQAILRAIDIKRNISITNRGNAFVARCPLPPLYDGFKDLHQNIYNPAEAKSILNRDGISKQITLNFYVASYLFNRKTLIELIKSQLSKVGINLIVKYFDQWEEFDKAIDDHNCHLFFNGYSSELIGDPGNFLSALFHSKSENNRTNYKNNDVDKLIDRALSEPNDDKRHEIYRQIVQIVLADIPAVYLAHVKSHFAYNSQKIKSLAVNPYEFIYYHRLETYD